MCLRAREIGLRTVWTPHSILLHHESASRGACDDTTGKREILIREGNYMKEKWGRLLYKDPFYNPNLNIQEGDFSLSFPPRISKY